MDDPEYSTFLNIMFNTWTADEMAYQAHIQQEAIKWIDDLMKEIDENS